MSNYFLYSFDEVYNRPAIIYPRYACGEFMCNIVKNLKKIVQNFKNISKFKNCKLLIFFEKDELIIISLVVASYSSKHLTIPFTIDQDDIIHYSSKICIFDTNTYNSDINNKYTEELEYSKSQITNIYIYTKTIVHDCLLLDDDDYDDYKTSTAQYFTTINENGDVYNFYDYDNGELYYVEYNVPVICPVREIKYFDHTSQYIEGIIIFYTNNLVSHITEDNKILLGTMSDFKESYNLNSFNFKNGKIYVSFIDIATTDLLREKKFIDIAIKNVFESLSFKTIFCLVKKNITTLTIIKVIMISIYGYSKSLIDLIDSIITKCLNIS